MSLGRNSFSRAMASRLAWRFAAPLATFACLLAASPASAASLSGPISGWQKGTEPAWVSMYEYVPTSLAANAPILVLVHYCGGNAAGVLGEAQGGGIVADADKYGFLIVLPQTSQNCWDVATTPSLTHNGGGDTGAIVDQVKYAITKHGSNANRVYVTGTSSGAMMAEGLAAVYPDVFKGSSEFSGVPAGCWSVSDPAGQWSGPCAGGSVTHTAVEWGNMVRAMYPGYTGFRPRIQLWHGQADSIISFTNQTEAIKEWTNVLGLATNPTSSTSVTISSHQYTRQQWLDSCGITVLDAWTETNGPHGTDANLNATYTIPFFNLDKTLTTDPQAAGCSSSSGAGGSIGTGGSTGTGGSSATGGSTGTGGAGGTGRGGSSGVAGTSGSTGGSTGTGGSSSTGTGGTIGSTGGSTGTGTGGTGAVTGAGGSTGTGGTIDTGTGGTGTTTGTGGDTGTTTGTGGGTGATASSQPGCSCTLASAPGAVDAFVLAGFLAVMFGRRRTKRSTGSTANRSSTT